MQEPYEQLHEKMTTAIEDLAAVRNDLQEQVQQYRAANKVLQQLLNNNQLLQLSILNTKQAAALLSVTPRTIRTWCTAGVLKAFRYHGGKSTALFFRLHDLLTFQQQQLALVAGD